MELSFKKLAFLVILISTLFRVFIANQLEFGNDEVYYWLYAKYPAISHFDHPPFVGFFIQLFTCNLYFDSELAIRLAAIIPASINMYVLFLIGKQLKGDKTGFISVLLYNLNIYGLIISGTFILPDAPMLFFWLLSFYFFLQVLPNTPSKKANIKLFIAFFFTGCAIYSKYQAIFICLGVFLYVLFFNRKWLNKWFFYFSFIFPLIAVSLIFYWNYQNDFISYTFYNNRVSLFSLSFNKGSFLREISGQVLYNDPYIYIGILIMLFAFFKKRFKMEDELMYLFLLFSIPLIVTTMYLSLFRDTLPHWSGVSYIIMLPMLAVFLSEKNKIIKNLIKGMFGLILLLAFMAVEINKGWFLPVKQSLKLEHQGKNDVFNDMYGWKQASEKITDILNDKKLTGLPIISNRWYPAAHIHYYIAKPNQMGLYGIGGLSSVHKYHWINKSLPSLNKEVLYITDSRNYKKPEHLYNKEGYSKMTLLDTVPIKRNKKTVKNIFLYRLTKE